MSEKSDTFKLVNAMELAKEARVGMELTYFDVVALIDDLREENANLTARIAELEMKIRHNALWQASEDAEERAHLEKLVPDLKKRIDNLTAENKVLEDACEILRKENRRLFSQVFLNAYGKENEE